MFRNVYFLIASVLFSMVLTGAATAQSYPLKPVRIVVPYPQGGLDPSIRVMTPKMGEFLGQSVIIDNRPGANGMIGAELVARAAPDGYTLLYLAPSTMVSGVLLLKEAKIDPIRDFSPVIEFYRATRALAVHTSLALNNLRDLVDYGKRYPGKISYGSGGIGSSFHLETEAFKMVSGLDMVHVPYKGTGPFTQDLMVGLVQFGIIPLQNLLPHVAAGKVKLLAVVADRRDVLAPEVPPVYETFPNMIKVGGWVGMFGPAGLPRPVTQRIIDSVLAAFKAPEVREFYARQGLGITATPTEQFGAMLKMDLDRTAQLIREIGIKPE
jgi:tripartite-type tricarboxylate transporter receptor subunit TctC